jgi:hypothetical protein
MIGRSIVSPAFDAVWFVGPGALSLLVALVLGATGHADAPLGVVGWIALVLLVDVAHVWATLWRTYLDTEVRARQRRRLLVLPALVAWLGFLLHLESPAAFWTVLAYVAIFHFVMQHIGFAAIFGRKRGESAFDRRLAKVAIWAGTAGPVVWWHANLPRQFAWFTEGDLVTGAPTVLGDVALVVEAAVLLGFVARRIQLGVRGRGDAMVTALVLLPAANWTVGIVVFDGDAAFTVTNVLMHGVPYLGLVWVAGGRRNVASAIARARGRGVAAGVAALVVAYGGGLVALAWIEEALWDRLVWHDHDALFGAPIVVEHPVATAAVVALLTVPQATHYLLDRWIWRAGPDNPRLAEDLGLVP